MLKIFLSIRNNSYGQFVLFPHKELWKRDLKKKHTKKRLKFQMKGVTQMAKITTQYNTYITAESIKAL